LISVTVPSPFTITETIILKSNLFVRKKFTNIGSFLTLKIDCFYCNINSILPLTKKLRTKGSPACPFRVIDWLIFLVTCWSPITDKLFNPIISFTVLLSDECVLAIENPIPFQEVKPFSKFLFKIKFCSSWRFALYFRGSEIAITLLFNW